MKKTGQEPKDTPKLLNSFLHPYWNGKQPAFSSGKIISPSDLNAVYGPNNAILYTTTDGTGGSPNIPVAKTSKLPPGSLVNNPPAYSPYILNPQPVLGTFNFQGKLKNLSGYSGFMGQIEQRINDYLTQREREVMKGRYQEDFLTLVLGLTIEEMREGWCLIKYQNKLSDDLTLCSIIQGKSLPLLHRCNTNVGGKMYSKLTSNMSQDKTWCENCEVEFPNDLNTYLTITYA